MTRKQAYCQVSSKTLSRSAHTCFGPCCGTPCRNRAISGIDGYPALFTQHLSIVRSDISNQEVCRCFKLASDPVSVPPEHTQLTEASAIRIHSTAGNDCTVHILASFRHLSSARLMTTWGNTCSLSVSSLALVRAFLLTLQAPLTCTWSGMIRAGNHKRSSKAATSLPSGQLTSSPGTA